MLCKLVAFEIIILIKIAIVINFRRKWDKFVIIKIIKIIKRYKIGLVLLIWLILELTIIKNILELELILFKLGQIRIKTVTGYQWII